MDIGPSLFNSGSNIEDDRMLSKALEIAVVTLFSAIKSTYNFKKGFKSRHMYQAHVASITSANAETYKPEADTLTAINGIVCFEIKRTLEHLTSVGVYKLLREAVISEPQNPNHPGFNVIALMLLSKVISISLFLSGSPFEKLRLVYPNIILPQYSADNNIDRRLQIAIQNVIQAPLEVEGDELIIAAADANTMSEEIKYEHFGGLVFPRHLNPIVMGALNIKFSVAGEAEYGQIVPERCSGIDLVREINAKYVGNMTRGDKDLLRTINNMSQGPKVNLLILENAFRTEIAHFSGRQGQVDIQEFLEKEPENKYPYEGKPRAAWKGKAEAPAYIDPDSMRQELSEDPKAAARGESQEYPSQPIWDLEATKRKEEGLFRRRSGLIPSVLSGPVGLIKNTDLVKLNKPLGVPQLTYMPPITPNNNNNNNGVGRFDDSDSDNDMNAGKRRKSKKARKTKKTKKVMKTKKRNLKKKNLKKTKKSK